MTGVTLVKSLPHGETRHSIKHRPWPTRTCVEPLHGGSHRKAAREPSPTSQPGTFRTEESQEGEVGAV